ncbi:MAG TPA: tRNA (adenosine(37)-N6)-threonylcarbamoyltransferase complex dimerization subunit type 1 TsaB [Xanthobacteraceae bacterium]|jgi:tRNA threonylcarbamoyl adenosine modification protein YeaZ
MRVLAIDTALAVCAAAVLDTTSGDIVAGESLPMVRGHAEALMPLIGRIIEQSAMALADIDRVVVTTGPGSFTGVRVGIAAARGIALAAAKPAVGVSTLCAYAAPHLSTDKTLAVVAVVEARHGQVYLQAFAPGGRERLAPRLAPLHEAVQAAAESRCCIVGSAAPAVAAGLSKAGAHAAVIDARGAPDIAWVARVGATVAAERSPPQPQYLSAPNARPQNRSQLPRR